MKRRDKTLTTVQFRLRFDFIGVHEGGVARDVATYYCQAFYYGHLREIMVWISCVLDRFMKLLWLLVYVFHGEEEDMMMEEGNVYGELKKRW